MSTTSGLIGTICACATAIAAVAGFGYYLGRDTAESEVSQLERELEMFKSAQDVKNALEYLDDLSVYNDNLFRFKEYEEKMATRDAEIAKLSSDVELLHTRLADSELQIKDASSALLIGRQTIGELTDALEEKHELNDTITLKEGQSHRFSASAIVVGVQSIYSSRAVITLQNEMEFINVGQGFTIQKEDTRCTVTLRKINENQEATFDLICRLRKSS